MEVLNVWQLLYIPSPGLFNKTYIQSVYNVTGSNLNPDDIYIYIYIYIYFNPYLLFCTFKFICKSSEETMIVVMFFAEIYGDFSKFTTPPIPTWNQDTYQETWKDLNETS